MCNHYANDLRKIGMFLEGLTGEQFSEKRIPLRFGNLPTHIYPDRHALTVRRDRDAGGWALETMRWGFPAPAPGAPPVTNVRNTEKPFWRKWLAPEHRCLVPATAFAEYDQAPPGKKQEHWFAPKSGEPFWFAGIWRDWEGARGPKKAPELGTHRLYSFLTTEPNAEVAAIHPKAMPVILSNDEADAWLSYPTDDAIATFQRPLPDGALVIVDAPAKESAST
jgi:putative SOS response-associated peptidase YedK